MESIIIMNCKARFILIFYLIGPFIITIPCPVTVLEIQCDMQSYIQLIRRQVANFSGYTMVSRIQWADEDFKIKNHGPKTRMRLHG